MRPLSPADVAAVEAWWPEAVATAGLDVELDALMREAEALVIARSGSNEPIGLVAYTRSARGWLEFRIVALAAGHRGWGYGSEAVRLVEAYGLASRFAADVSAANGLGLYFWLRMGYRPAGKGEVPWQKGKAADVMTMVREAVP
jgi:RimJ/RimL family protein N-acetyltransferase